MTKITGAMLQAIKRSGLTEEQILARLAAKTDETPAETTPAPRGRRGKYETRDMRAEA